MTCASKVRRMRPPTPPRNRQRAVKARTKTRRAQRRLRMKQMPDWGWYPNVLPVKVYRGWYGEMAKLRIQSRCWRRGRRAVFPDC